MIDYQRVEGDSTVAHLRNEVERLRAENEKLRNGNFTIEWWRKPDGTTTSPAQEEIERLRNERDEALSNFGTSRRAHEASLTDLNAEIERLRIANERLRAALLTADAAINPPDRTGISLATWNDRLKAATTKIRDAFG